MLAGLRPFTDRYPIVGDVRGDGYFLAIELVTDQATRGTFDAEAADWLLRGYLSPRLFAAGLICRADDRAELESIYETLDGLNPRKVQTQSYRPEIELYYWPLAIAVLLSMALFGFNELRINFRSRREGAA